jgi:NAD(P) transhydrogenase subunit alpha
MSEPSPLVVVGIPRERATGERRVAAVPATVPLLRKLGCEVVVERGAGVAAGYPDEAYAERGARLDDRAAAFAADVVLQVTTYPAGDEGPDALRALRSGQIVIGHADPLGAPARVAELAARGVTGFGLELVPRTSRAQVMDVLSSQASIAGYRAALLAAERLPRLFPMLMTAAGTVQATKVLVMGAGVAGLQAIATARRLGAVVSAYDVRPAVREQVASLGARFVDLGVDAGGEAQGGYARAQGEDVLRRQREALAAVVADADVVITTAAIPGRPAPILVTAAMVAAMRPGSVIVDVAAERGGNCELTRAGEEVRAHGVTIVGAVGLASTAAFHASQLYARNLAAFLGLLVKDGRLALDRADDVVAATLLCEGGEVVAPAVRERLVAAAEPTVRLRVAHAR